MARKYGAMKITNIVLGIAAFLFLLSLGLNAVFGFDFNKIFVVVMYGATGIYLLAQGGVKVVKKASATNIFHAISFAFGVLFVYLALIGIPILERLDVAFVTQMTGVITLIGAAIALVEVWVK